MTQPASTTIGYSARPTYDWSRTSTSTVSPVAMYAGTRICKPFSKFAGFKSTFLDLSAARVSCPNNVGYNTAGKQTGHRTYGNSNGNLILC